MTWLRRRRIVLAVLAGAGCGVASLAPPRRFTVVGPSMVPALQPGDVVSTGLFPLRDRLVPPRRFDRWVLAAADGTAVIKRVVGLPGETVAVGDGNLTIDGRTFLKGPRLLAEMGSPVAADQPAAAPAATPPPTAEAWSAAAGPVLDDAPEATGAGLLLEPVRDVGLAAVVRVADRPNPAGLPVRARVGAWTVTWRLRDAGRYAFVAGRLDGHVVAAAWKVPAAAEAAPGSRSCLPAGPPERWPTAAPWNAGRADAGAGSEARSDADDAPLLAIGLGSAAAAGSPAATLEHAWRWRDVLLRPAPDGRTAWTLEPGTLFVLGDFPLGSRDSRHWGPLPTAALRWLIRLPPGG